MTENKIFSKFLDVEKFKYYVYYNDASKSFDQALILYILQEKQRMGIIIVTTTNIQQKLLIKKEEQHLILNDIYECPVDIQHFHCTKTTIFFI